MKVFVYLPVVRFRYSFEKSPVVLLGISVIYHFVHKENGIYSSPLWVSLCALLLNDLTPLGNFSNLSTWRNETFFYLPVVRFRYSFEKSTVDFWWISVIYHFVHKENDIYSSPLWISHCALLLNLVTPLGNFSNLSTWRQWKFHLHAMCEIQVFFW